MVTIATIGYQGATPEALIATLAGAGVRLLADVRAVPASRIPGFSRRDLAAALDAAGIGYRHLPALGNPAAGRAAARAGDLETYRRLYRARLDRPDARAALAGLLEAAAARRVCLICLERDPARCHRALIIERLKEESGGALAVEHLHVPREGDPRQRGLGL